MAILEHQVRSLFDTAATGLCRRLFSSEDYHRMASSGIFEGQRIELIEGEIIEMAPIGSAHSAVTNPLTVLLGTAFGPAYTVRNQGPFLLAGDQRPSEPQPDIAVAIGSWRDYVSQIPAAQHLRLIVEVADSSLRDDRRTKAALYASAGIPEYWIVNLVDNNLEVYRDPVDGAYVLQSVYTADDEIIPLFASHPVIVGEFLP